MRKKFLSVALALCMVVSLLPTMALAADPTGAFTVTGGTLGTDYSYANHILSILTDAAITIANATPTTATTTDKIVVNSPADKTANITLAGVNIDLSSADDVAAFEITSTAGAVNLTLADGTTNTLKSSGPCAGLQKDTTADGTLLTISGTGSLAATGGGIGGGASASNIVISGSTVNANGGVYGGAGIDGSTNNIVISGGNIKASIIEPTPTNGAATLANVYLATFTVPGDTDASSMTFTSGGSDYNYTMTDAKSMLDSGATAVKSMSISPKARQPRHTAARPMPPRLTTRARRCLRSPRRRSTLWARRRARTTPLTIQTKFCTSTLPRTRRISVQTAIHTLPIPSIWTMTLTSAIFSGRRWALP